MLTGGVIPPSSQLSALAETLSDCRALTEVLAAPLSAEDQTVQSMPDTSPTKWHRAHTTWFFETFVLRPHLEGYEVFDDRFGYLFNSYYEAVGARHPRPQRGMVTRPGVAEVGAYRRHVDGAMAKLLDLAAAADGATTTKLADLVELGIHHEQQHQELLLMDIKHVLAGDIVDPAYRPAPHQPAPEPGPARWVDVDGGVVEIGLDPESEGFRFDNEHPRHRVLVEPYRLADRLVTCGEWLAFMADGGYEDPQLWLSDGWHRRGAEGWTAPLYWTADEDGAWQIHTLNGTRPVDPNEPVCHLSFYEADAFATWAGARLPTEAEWEHAAASRGHRAGRQLDPSGEGLDRLHPGPAGPVADRELRQLIGDCWEWTGSAYRPYPGYEAPSGAIGEYNGKFMVNTMVLKGGCALTPAGHVRTTYRNFFHPHTRWHLSGVRLAAR